MICKECGAYNPDHAEFCKVCAANLKGKPATQEAKLSEDDLKPTKRFIRPSWMSDSAEKAEEPAVEFTDDINLSDENIISDEKIIDVNAVNDVQDSEQIEDNTVVDEKPEAEEEPAKIWSPVAGRRKAAQRASLEDKEDDADSEDDNDGIYNDEEALDDEDDSFEYEPTPPKRKQQKKKNNTLFTVLLIAIIVVIVALLVLGGYMLLKNRLNCGSSGRNNGGASETSTLESPAPSTTDPEVVPTEAPTALDEKTAQLQEIIDEEHKEWIAITVVIPANSTVVIDLPVQDDYSFTNEESKSVIRKVKIQVEAFYQNVPLEEETVEFHPDITINSADGSSYKVDCPSFTRTFPKLNITVTSPLPEGDEPIMAPENNVIQLQGTIDDPTAEVLVNDQVVVVYTGGVFMYDYVFPDNATEDTEDTITIVARKSNCVSDTQEIKVHAYKFIPEPMKLEVKSEGASLRADKNGKLTVTGTTLPGATLTATSDNATNVLCGSVNVDGEGNFSFQITMDAGFYGMSAITLDAVKEGAENGSTKFTVTRGFADKESFLKYYNKTKSYLEIPAKIKLEDLLSNQAQYASNSYGFRITATVVEVINNDGDVIVKMTMNKTNETVYVHNMSEKWAPGENVGGKYNVYGNFTGTYSDTGCCEFIAWFAKKA